MKCRIVYEDEAILVIHKPAGLATQSASVGQADAVSELKGYLARQGKKSGRKSGGGTETPYLGVVHRLDQPVEGLLVFARTPKAAAALSGQLEHGTLQKKYLAAVCGKPEADEGQLTDYLRKENGRAEVVTDCREKYPDAKMARLSYRKAQAKGRSYSVLEVQIETGRFHQIRAQLAHAGMPILGDQKYGDAGSRELAQRLGIRNVALCANRLDFLHPVTGRGMSFECPPSWSGNVQ